ncbi:unnamed protein product [Rhodiola kirilowii]
MEATAAANVAASPMNNMSSLYVGDLHPDVADEQLVQAFSEFQSLASVRVCRDTRNNDKSLGYGYLNFQSAQDAAQALKTKNHMKLNGKPVRLMWSKRDSDFRRNGIGNVFVKNLSESVDHEKLEDKFKEFGNILSCKVGTSEDGSSKGYGFVQFETEDAANSAIKMVNGTDFHGKKIYVGPHVRKADRALPNPDDQYTNLYVKNLDVDITEEELREMFSKFGTISSPVISVDEHGSSKGFGFVNFVKPDDARRAVEAMNGLQLGSKVLYVGRAQKKSNVNECYANSLKKSVWSRFKNIRVLMSMSRILMIVSLKICSENSLVNAVRLHLSSSCKMKRESAGDLDSSASQLLRRLAKL